VSFDTSRSVLVTGGEGFLGRRVARQIRAMHPDIHIVLCDIAQQRGPIESPPRTAYVRVDLSERTAVERLIDQEVGTVFHLASLVSGGAEKDFEAGFRANITATINILEACRATGRRPRVIFTSSIATFGGADLPAEVSDTTYQHPQTSYGVAKVVGEQLLNDYSRRGFLSGRGVRLPAIAVRDTPNSAASGYVSSIVRETINGRHYTCPVSREACIPIMGVDTAVGLLVRLAEIEEDLLGDYRTVNGHGISPTAGEIAEAALSLVPEGEARIPVAFAPDPDTERMIASWPRRMRADRADRLGLPGDSSIDDIVSSYASSARGEPEDAAEHAR
jgi:nucleoside-diphosphate-sugar epimerase